MKGVSADRTASGSQTRNTKHHMEKKDPTAGHTPGPWPEPQPGSDNGWATMTIDDGDELHVVVTAPNVSEQEDGTWDNEAAGLRMEATAHLIRQAPTLKAENERLQDRLDWMTQAALDLVKTLERAGLTDELEDQIAAIRDLTTLTK